MNLRHFRSASEFRRWLEKHHASETELRVAFYRKGCGRTGMTYPEAVDEALCYGWIDGVRKKVDEISYTNRFSPRTARSIWSAINLKRIEVLKGEGRVAPPGLKALESRDPKRSGLYSFENRPTSLGAAYGAALQSGQSRLAVLPHAGAVLPARRDLVGRQRREGGHATTAARRPHRAIETRSAYSGGLFIDPALTTPAAGR